MGRKLRGRFALIHTGARLPAGSGEANHWLLVKKTDPHASTTRDLIVDEPHSVLSGLTVEELARLKDIVGELEAEAEALGAPAGAVPTHKLTPMLCSSNEVDLCDRQRLYELKLDGVRIIAERRGADAELRYRGGRSATAAYPEIARAMRALPATRVVLDGEVVAFDDGGRPSFQRLGRRIHLIEPGHVRRAIHEVPVSFVVFDVLELGRFDLRPLPLVQRKRLLSRLLPGRGLIRVLDHLEGDGRPLMTFCDQQQLEGVVCKRLDSPYRMGPKRYDDWIKLKRFRDADLVVVGWEESEKVERKLRSLLLAAYDDEDRLVLRGKAGSGLDEATIDALLARLRPLATKSCAAEGSVTRHGKRHYVRPELVASVRFAGLSDGGTLKHPVFRGLREDVAPASCVLATGDEVADHAQRHPIEPQPASTDDRVRAAEVALHAGLSNQDKVFWPDEGYTKGNLCDYYAAVAPALVPLLKSRPIVLVRYPDGIAGKSFYQWRAPRGTPTWLRTLRVRQEGERGKAEKSTFLVDDVDGLLHIVNLGCIPIHILAAREQHLDRCDFLTIDFDVGEQPFSHAVELALGLHELLDEIGLCGFPKTSGQSGMHVLVPVGGVPFAAAKTLVELLGRLLCLRRADIATMERRVERRGDKVLIDVGQTGRSRTIVAPYSVRAVPGATVSTPLFWDEVHRALDPRRYTMFSVPARFAELGDPMARLLEVDVDVAGAVAKLGAKLG
jgi:bifunctional non-homologous end joining protein LigD